MIKVRYCNKFFKTEEQAKAFQKERGYGVLYKNTPHSRTKKQYETEADMMGVSQKEREKHPFVVAWNEKVE